MSAGFRDGAGDGVGVGIRIGSRGVDQGKTLAQMRIEQTAGKAE